MSSALLVLDDLEKRAGVLPRIVLGGGTVLMFRFGHRLSRDIDFFVEDVQWLSMLTPRLNDRTAALSIDYVEQANSVKLVLAEGDIDFVAAAPVTQASPADRLAFEGRSFDLEATEEILAKKLLYRAEHLKPRDVFDLVAVARLDPSAARRAVEAAASKGKSLQRRLDQLAGRSRDELAKDIVPLPGFDDVIGEMIDVARGLVSQAPS